MRIQLVEHDPRWAARFAGERKRVAGALALDPTAIEHIGSTAIPGIAAKPVIDVLVTTPTPADDQSFPPVATALETIGYRLSHADAEHALFKNAADDVNIHLWPKGHDAALYLVLFRDWLRHSHADRLIYEAEKRRLADHDWSSTNDYAEAKSGVINDILYRARWAFSQGLDPFRRPERS